MDVNETKQQVFLDLLQMKKQELTEAYNILAGSANELDRAQREYDKRRLYLDKLENEISVIQEVLNG